MSLIEVLAGSIDGILTDISSYCSQARAISVWIALIKENFCLNRTLCTYECLYHIHLGRKLSPHHDSCISAKQKSITTVLYRLAKQFGIDVIHQISIIHFNEAANMVDKKVKSWLANST